MFKCDNCGSSDTYVKNYKHEYNIKGEKVIFEKERRFCRKCNKLVFDAYLDNDASKEAIKKYNNIIGICAEDIIKLRKKYSLSQEQFAKIIGCAKKTLVSYENSKSIPNDIYLITIKTLIDNSDIIIYLIDSNKNRFDDKEYNTIISKVKKGIGPNIKNSEDLTLSEYNGYTKLSFEKLKNLILILCKNSINKTKLLKEMFYCDFLCYKENGASITGLVYSKLNYGPVPDDYEKILDNFVSSKVLDCNSKFKNDFVSIIYSSKEKIDYSIFNDEEINVIKKVKEYFKNFNSQKIVEFSHNEAAFIKTKFYKNISYDYAFDINL